MVSAGPALANDTGGAQEVMSKMAAEARAGVNQIRQQANQPLARASDQRGVQAVTASNVFYDAIGDALLAPDLRQMVALTSDDGRYSVGVTLDSNGLIEGDFVATYVNTDGNPATGSPVFGGADLAVGILGHIGQDSVGALLWNGISFQTAAFPSLISFASGSTDEVWSISAAELGIAPGTATTLAFASMYSGIYDDYFDFAPEPGLAPFGFTTGSASGPPPAAVAPTPVAPTPVAPPAPTVGVSAAAPSSPLTIRSFGVSKMRGAVKFRLAWVEGEGRVVWYLTLSARVNGRLLTKVVRGGGQAGSRTIKRTIRLPESWAGARISAHLEVDNGQRSLFRARSIRF
jgi:hypothetical protein